MAYTGGFEIKKLRAMLKVDQNTNLSINIKLKEKQYHRTENFPQKTGPLFYLF